MMPHNLILTNLPPVKNSAKKEKNSLAGVLLCRFLSIVLFLITLCIVGVTIYVFISKSLARGKPLYAVPAPETVVIVSPEDAVFSSVGRLRGFTADKPSQTVIVSIAFPYDKEDIPFVEELVSKIIDFRTIALSYFQHFSAETLKKKGEGEVKKDLLNSYNGILKLGRISTLYFNDFIIIE
jgi:flagellar basal body-associated protein FliL